DRGVRRGAGPRQPAVRGERERSVHLYGRLRHAARRADGGGLSAGAPGDARRSDRRPARLRGNGGHGGDARNGGEHAMYGTEKTEGTVIHRETEQRRRTE